MLEVVAHYDPVDYHKLKRLVGQRLDGEYNTEKHRSVLKNLKELNMIERPNPRIYPHHRAGLVASRW
ncbi:hypothetical protein ACFQL4_04995 [Halosimplex aquaticum]